MEIEPTKQNEKEPARKRRRNWRNAMKAIQYQAYGGYQENRLVDVERPIPKDGEVLVEMRAVGINPLDNTFRSGHIYLSKPENLPRIGGQTRSEERRVGKESTGKWVLCQRIH